MRTRPRAGSFKLFSGGAVMLAFTVFFGELSPAGAQGFGIGLYKDGQLVEQLGAPIIFADPAQESLAAAGDAAALATLRTNQRIANVRAAETSALTESRKAAFAQSAESEARVRTILRELKTGADLQRGLEALRAARDQLTAAYAGVQMALEQSELRVLQLALGENILGRHDTTATAIEKAYQALTQLLDRVLAGEPGALEKAIAAVDAMAPPAPPLLEGRPPTVQSHIERAPELTREQADALLPGAPAQTLALGAAAAVTLPGDLAPTIEVQLTPEIASKAASLGNSPLAIYEFVRNKVRFQPYLGSRKGAVETLRQLHGNDTDQASLLLALLRASNIPCRYVRGTVEMTPEAAKSWLGVDDAHTAGSILTTAGLNGVNIVEGSAVVAIRCTRVWVEAFVPYSNYRGAPRETTGKTWVPLDPAFKRSTITPGQDVLTAMGFDTDAFLADYISTFHAASPIEKFVADIQTYLNTAQPGVSVADVERRAEVSLQALGLLPASLPQEVRSVSGRFSELEDAKRYKVRFRLYNGGTTFIDYTTNLSQIISSAVTIDYIGATAADQATIDSHGGIYETPPNLVNVKPRLKLDGTPLVISTNAIGMGRTHSSDMQFYQPSGASNVQPLIQNEIIAGNGQAIAFDTFLDSRDSFLFGGGPSLTLLESELHSTAVGYLSRCDRGQEQVERLMQIVSTQDVSEAIVESSVAVTYSFGNPVTFEWTGLIVDADRRIVGPFAVDGDDSKHVPYMFLTGYDGSTMENRIFEDTYDQDAVSTIKILELSRDQGIPVYRIVTSIAADAPGLNQPPSVVAAINAALAKGHHVIIPRTGITVGNWSGTGYIDLDPNTGAAGYIISGGISGAVSSNGGATVQTWPISLACKVKSLTGRVLTPAMDTPDLAAIFCPDNTPFTFQIEVTIVCDDGSPSGLPQPPFTKTMTTNNTKKQILDAFGPGDYELSLPGYPGFQKRKITLVKIEVEIFKPGVIDPAQPMIPKDDRLSKGSMTFVNVDNDDNDTKFDLNDDTVAGGDNELVKYKVKIQPKTLGAGNFKITAAAGGSSVKLWKANDKAAANAYNPGDSLTVPADLTVEGDALVKDLWIEGIQPHSSQRVARLRAEYSAAARTTNDEAALTVIGVDKIDLEGQSNSRSDSNALDADPNWPAGLSVASLRVFPDSRTDGGAVRDKVTVKAKLSVAPVDPVKIYFRSFDVDDPTDDAAPVDDDTATGTAEDNRGTSPARAGKITGADGSGIFEQSFNVIEKTFDFQTTMNPGDNFRIAASCDKPFLGRLENKDTVAGASNDDRQRITDPAVAGTPASKELLDAAKYVSSSLVVWRFLHVEKDSMVAVPAGQNLISTSVTGFTGSAAAATRLKVSTALNDGSPDLDDATAGNGRFEKGTAQLPAGARAIASLTGNDDDEVVFPAAVIVPVPFAAQDNDFILNGTMSGDVTNIVQSGTSFVLTLSITAHNETPIDWPDFVGGSVTIAGGTAMPITAVNAAASTVTVSALQIPAELADDDDRSILPKVGDLSHLVTVMAETYVVVLDDGGGSAGNNQLTATFIPNLTTTSSATGEAAFQRQAGGSDGFWVGYLLMSYQYSADSDNDPNLTATGGEGGTGGVAWAVTSNTGVAKGGRGTQVFVETVRDRVANGALAGLEQRVTAHEIGHQLGLDHWDTGEAGVTGAVPVNLMLRTMQSTPTASALLAPFHKHIIRSRVKSPGL